MRVCVCMERETASEREQRRGEELCRTQEMDQDMQDVQVRYASYSSSKICKLFKTCKICKISQTCKIF